MIVIYTGTPGSSKTLHAVKDIRYALTKPSSTAQPVIANFEINYDARLKHMDAFHYFDNDEITPKMLTDFADDFWLHGGVPFHEDYLLLVLDECQLIFNARSWQDKGRRGRGDSRLDWLEFLSQHRKYGYKVILIAQSSKMIDNQFRMLIEVEVNHRACTSMGIFGTVMQILPFKMFFWVKLLYQTREPLGMRPYVMQMRHARLYDTHARLNKVLGT